MLLLLDTEFTDILNPKLISLGLVSDCGCHEFYAELTDFNRRACSRFVWKVVLPKLGQIPAAQADRATVAAALTAWLAQLPDSVIEIGFDFGGDWTLIQPLIGRRSPEPVCAAPPLAFHHDRQLAAQITHRDSRAGSPRPLGRPCAAPELAGCPGHCAEPHDFEVCDGLTNPVETARR